MRITIFTLIIVLFAACQTPSGDKSSSDKAANKTKLNVVATTGMVADLLTNVLGEHGAVTSLMGPGVDPHLYKPTQGDLNRLTKADIVFYNGLHLEGKMQSILEKMARTKSVHAISDELDKSRLIVVNEKDGHKIYDPHIWFDVDLWSTSINKVVADLSAELPEQKAVFKTNGETYRQKLIDLHATAERTINQIPEANRVLVTSHDAFGYFGRAYGIEVKALQGISTVTEFGLKDVTNLVAFLIEEKVGAVFVESSMPEKPLQAVIEGCRKKGHNVIKGGLLYSDAMGESGTPEGAYIGMVNHNISTISEALK